MGLVSLGGVVGKPQSIRRSLLRRFARGPTWHLVPGSGSGRKVGAGWFPKLKIPRIVGLDWCFGLAWIGGLPGWFGGLDPQEPEDILIAGFTGMCGSPFLDLDPSKIVGCPIGFPLKPIILVQPKRDTLRKDTP